MHTLQQRYLHLNSFTSCMKLLRSLKFLRISEKIKYTVFVCLLSFVLNRLEEDRTLSHSVHQTFNVVE